MLKEAIEKIEVLIEDQNREHVYDRGKIGSGQLIIDNNVSVSVFAARNPKYEVTSVDAFCAAVKTFQVEGSTIWVSEKEVVAILAAVAGWIGFDEHTPEVDGAHVLTAPLPPLVTMDVQLVSLITNEGVWPTSVDQKKLNHFLSFHLAHAKIEPDIREIVRKIKWASSDEMSREIKQGGDAMGRSVRAEASGATEFPERVKIYLDPVRKPAGGFVQVTIEAMFVVDPSDRQVGLIPLPGELDRARTQALDQIKRQITSKLPTWESSTFLGTPVL